MLTCCDHNRGRRGERQRSCSINGSVATIASRRCRAHGRCLPAALDIANQALFLEDNAKHATAFVTHIAEHTRVVTYASAGHQPPALRWHQGGVELLSLPGLPLGVDNDPHYETRSILIDRAGISRSLYGRRDGAHSRRHCWCNHLVTVERDAFLRDAHKARFVQRATVGDAPKDDVAVLVARFGNVEAAAVPLMSTRLP